MQPVTTPMAEVFISYARAERGARSLDPQYLFQIAVAESFALRDLLPRLGNRRQKSGIALARIPLQIVVIERHEQSDRVTVTHHQHLFLFALAHQLFARSRVRPGNHFHGDSSGVGCVLFVSTRSTWTRCDSSSTS